MPVKWVLHYPPSQGTSEMLVELDQAERPMGERGPPMGQLGSVTASMPGSLQHQTPSDGWDPPSV